MNNLGYNMKKNTDKYVIIDLRTMDYMKDEQGNITYYNTENEACETCGMYEFENAWVCKLIYNHIEDEVLTYKERVELNNIEREKEREIKQYRMKPIVIEAIIWNGKNINQMNVFMGKYPKVIDRRIRIKTLEGSIYADEGDYIIKGINGEFYPCKPDIFKKSYDEINV